MKMIQQGAKKIQIKMQIIFVSLVLFYFERDNALFLNRTHAGLFQIRKQNVGLIFTFHLPFSPPS